MLHFILLLFLEISELEFVIAFGLFIFLFLSIFIALFLIISYKRKRRYKQQLLKLKYEKQHTLLQSQIEIQEQTLRHISRELHDNLGQVASLIKINLTTLQLSDKDIAIEKIEDTKDLTRQLIADIKSLSVSLGSDRIKQIGLIKAIETEVQRLNKTGEFTASFEVQGLMPDIDKDKELILYRMAQEVLNNMLKHSGAKQINVLLTIGEKLFTLAFNDDGIGFNAEEKMNASGAGLRNLTSRALLINAQLNIRSSHGNGTEVKIELPF